MNRAVAVVGAAVAAGVTVAGLVLAPAAMADDAASPVACAEASVRVQTAAEAAVKAGDDLAKANAVLLAALQANLAAAEKAQAQKLAALQALLATEDPDPDAVEDARAALVEAELKVQEAAKALADAAPPSALKDKLAEAQAALKVAIERREKACDFVLPAVTPGPSVTVTVPPPTTRVPVPVEINTGYSPQL